MFFEIQPNANFDYPNNYQLNTHYYLNCDSGWVNLTSNDITVYYKGYNTTDLSDSEFIEQLVSDPIPKFNGLFIAVIIKEETITITSDVDRGWPIYYKESPNTITNIPFNPEVERGRWDDFTEKMLGASHQIKIIDNTIVIGNLTHPYYSYNDFSPLITSEVINKIDERIRYNFERVLTKNNKPIKIFLSGGLDSYLAFAYLKSFTNNFEIVMGERIDFTKFICKKIYNIRKTHWLPIIHHFNGQCLNVTGGFGDIRMLRTPQPNNLLLLANKIDILELAKKHKDSYQYNLIVSPGMQKIYKDQIDDPCTIDLEATYKKMYDMSIHTYGWWHVEENTLFNPLKDLALLNYCLRAPLDLQIEQIFDGKITKMLFEKTDPNLLKYVSHSKNQNNMKHLWELYENYNFNK